MRAPRVSRLALLGTAALLAGCVGVTRPDDGQRPWSPGESLRPAPVPAGHARSEPRVGRSIVIAGEHHPIDADVVLWTDRGGHDAHAPRADGTPGYRPGRARERGGPASRERADVLATVEQLVLHYDVSGTSARCFDTLRARGLSVHFLLDVDGTLYQTLDLADTAWHAGPANERSVGVEIAQIGAYPPGDPTLDRWYARDASGVRVVLPGSSGVRTPGFVARPARSGRLSGFVHGKPYEQYDFTDEQYESLAALAAALVRAFPRLPLAVPVDARGRLRTDALSPEEQARFRGIVGHFHVSRDKTDPGPAFDWPRFVHRTRELLRVAP